MIGFLSENHNHPRQYPNRHHHHFRRRRHDCDHFEKVKLVGSLTTVIILLLGTMISFTTSLPTPSSDNLANNHHLQQSREQRDNRHYFDNDQLLADLWTQLCGLTNRSGSCASRASLPVGVGTGGGGSDDGHNNGNVISNSNSGSTANPPEERQLLVEALQRFLQDAIMANDDGSSRNFASVTYEEEPITQQEYEPPREKLAPARHQAQSKLSAKLISNDENDEILENDSSPSSSSLLPFPDDDIQRQVIFIQIPETMVNLHVHESPPQTVVYVLPPKEETHQIRILDMRRESSSNDPSVAGAGNNQATPNIHFLTNFGSNKIDAVDNGLTTGQQTAYHNRNPNQANLHDQSQSKSNQSRGYYHNQQPQQHNRNNHNINHDQRFFPVQGVLMPPPIPAFIAGRINQQPHFSGQIGSDNANLKSANNAFEIVPAINGYFYV